MRECSMFGHYIETFSRALVGYHLGIIFSSSKKTDFVIFGNFFLLSCFILITIVSKLKTWYVWAFLHGIIFSLSCWKILLALYFCFFEVWLLVLKKLHQFKFSPMFSFLLFRSHTPSILRYLMTLFKGIGSMKLMYVDEMKF